MNDPKAKALFLNLCPLCSGNFKVEAEYNEVLTELNEIWK